MSQPQPLGPFTLVTVNTAPERAKMIVGRMIEAVRDRYTVIHVANAEAIKDVEALVKDVNPDILFCASMWTPEESEEIQRIAKETKPGIKTLVVPKGLQAEGGPDTVVKYVVTELPSIIAS